MKTSGEMKKDNGVTISAERKQGLVLKAGKIRITAEAMLDDFESQSSALFFFGNIEVSLKREYEKSVFIVAKANNPGNRFDDKHITAHLKKTGGYFLVGSAEAPHTMLDILLALEMVNAFRGSIDDAIDALYEVDELQKEAAK